MAIFNSYVKLPEGSGLKEYQNEVSPITIRLSDMACWWFSQLKSRNLDLGTGGFPVRHVWSP